MSKLVDFIPEFVDELEEQLKKDNERWGDTWRGRTREGQELRVRARYNDYFDMFVYTNKPVPWLKIVGNAFIAWVRENHPEELREE